MNDAALVDQTPCPCGSKAAFAACCGPMLAGRGGAPTAEGLMRSRYTAYVMADVAYLLRTWRVDARPGSIDAATIPQWRGLEILRVEKGQEGDGEGLVEFRATARSAHGLVCLREVSRFVREAGQWLYVGGDLLEEDGVAPEGKTAKVGRNSPCPCGSGKKLKKCCAS